MDEINRLREKIAKIKSILPELEEFIDLTEKISHRYEMAAAAFGPTSQVNLFSSKYDGKQIDNTKNRKKHGWKGNILRFLGTQSNISTSQLWQEFIREGIVNCGPTDSSFRTTLNLLRKRGEIIQAESESGTKLWSLPTGQAIPLKNEVDKVLWTENIFKFLKEKGCLTTKQLWDSFVGVKIINPENGSVQLHANLRFALNNLRKKGFLKQKPNPDGGRDMWEIIQEYTRA